MKLYAVLTILWLSIGGGCFAVDLWMAGIASWLASAANLVTMYLYREQGG